MLRVASGRLKVGERIYFKGETLTPEDEAVLRSRPAFGVLLEDGKVEEIVRQDPVIEPKPVPQPVVDGQTEESEAGSDQRSDDAGDDFSCPYCEFIGKNDRSLAMHIRRAHPDEE